jgi:cyclopropane-fatty-acyl-phospholipid synthase
VSVPRATSSAEYGGASATAIQQHYDVSNEFYALWLDPTLTYSCALWDGLGDDLYAAQLRKLDYLAEAARVNGGRVLDVGCGWGGLAARVLNHHGATHVTGLTLSAAQAEYMRARTDERCTVVVQNWADHQPNQQYDAIVSVGAFEHFADFGLTRPKRVEAYRAFFERCADWLPTGGRLALQTITKGSNIQLDRQTTRDLLFVIDRIFTESELPWPSEILEASERRFEVLSSVNHAEHYTRTCGVWLANLLAHRQQAVELVGESMVADYVRYLEICCYVFERRHVGLQRLLFHRV